MGNVVTDVKRIGLGDKETVVLSTGVKVKFTPVGASLIDAINSKFVQPEPPMMMIEDKGREEPNPMHPDYIKALNDHERAKGNAVIDALMVFGVELVDGMPEDESWVDKLKFLSKQMNQDVTGLDLTDKFERELAYKRLVVFSALDMDTLFRNTGVTQEAIDAAKENFRSTT